MIRHRFWAEDGSRYELRMTPLVDVVFLLLIFFVCTAQFRPPEQNLSARVAATETAGEEEPSVEELDQFGEIVVAVRRKDDKPIWFLGLVGQQMGRKQFALASELRSALSKLAEIRGDIPVFVDAAADVPLQDVVTTVDLCRQAGLTSVSLLAQGNPGGDFSL